MSLIIPEQTAPSAPSSARARIYFDSATKRLMMVRTDGTRVALTGTEATNLLANSGLWFAQRQAPGTLTTYSSTTTRVYGPDRWGLTNENASVQYQRVDTIAAVETGLAARHYGNFKKITSAGKVIVSQPLEATHTAPLRGQRVRFQFKAKNSVGSHTLRLGLLQLTSAGTVDTLPATFVSAFGAVATDPTWGTNLSAITPSVCNSTGTISGAGVSCVLGSSWVTYSGLFTVPSDCKNLVAVVFTSNQPAANDIFCLAELGLYLNDEECPFVPLQFGDELRRCQRHYWKSFNVDTAPAQNVGNGTGDLRWPASFAGVASNRSPSFSFPVTMFGAPTMTGYNPAAANAVARDQTNSVDCGTTNIVNVTERGCAITANGNAVTTVGAGIALHVSAEIEL